VKGFYDVIYHYSDILREKKFDAGQHTLNALFKRKVAVTRKVVLSKTVPAVRKATPNILHIFCE
jgi:uncharacterized protein Veg